MLLAVGNTTLEGVGAKESCECVLEATPSATMEAVVQRLCSRAELMVETTLGVSKCNDYDVWS